MPEAVKFHRCIQIGGVISTLLRQGVTVPLRSELQGDSLAVRVALRDGNPPNFMREDALAPVGITSSGVDLSLLKKMILSGDDPSWAVINGTVFRDQGLEDAKVSKLWGSDEGREQLAYLFAQAVLGRCTALGLPTLVGSEIFPKIHNLSVDCDGHFDLQLNRGLNSLTGLDNQLLIDHAIGLKLSQANVSRAMLALIAKLIHIKRLNLEGADFTDGSQSLSELAAQGAEKTDLPDPVRRLAGVVLASDGKVGLRNLDELTLSNSNVTDLGLNALRGLPSLTGLILHNTPVTDAGVPHLKAIKTLNFLDLTETNMTQGTLWREGVRVYYDVSPRNHG